MSASFARDFPWCASAEPVGALEGRGFGVRRGFGCRVPSARPNEIPDCPARTSSIRSCAPHSFLSSHFSGGAHAPRSGPRKPLEATNIGSPFFFRRFYSHFGSVRHLQGRDAPAGDAPHPGVTCTVPCESCIVIWTVPNPLVKEHGARSSVRPSAAKNQRELVTRRRRVLSRATASAPATRRCRHIRYSASHLANSAGSSLAFVPNTARRVSQRSTMFRREPGFKRLRNGPSSMRASDNDLQLAAAPNRWRLNRISFSIPVTDRAPSPQITPQASGVRAGRTPTPSPGGTCRVS